MFFLLGIFLAVFLGLLLLLKKNKSRADNILTIWLFFLCTTQLLRYLTWTGYFYDYPHWLGVELSLPILHAVLLYFYVREVTGNPLRNHWEVLAHFLTTVLLFILTIPFYLISAEEKILAYQNHGVGFEWFKKTSLPLLVLSGIAYSIWSLWIIRKHQIRIKDNFSNTDKKELQWLKYLVLGNLILYVLSIFYDNYIINMGIVTLVLFIGIFGINQLNIFYTAPKLETSTSDLNTAQEEQENKVTRKPSTPSKRYAKSGLNEEMAVQIYAKLQNFTAGEAIYKNENLTLSELADLLEAHPNHLSQVINEKEGKNFYNYINSIRIKEFIKLASLPENKKYTMMALAYDCGFSSKSTFNKHFKVSTGKTPTEFFNESVV